MESRSVTSAWMATAPWPSSSASAWMRSARRTSRARRKPLAASARAVASPMPDEARRDDGHAAGALVGSGVHAALGRLRFVAVASRIALGDLLELDDRARGPAGHDRPTCGVQAVITPATFTFTGGVPTGVAGRLRRPPGSRSGLWPPGAAGGRATRWPGPGRHGAARPGARGDGGARGGCLHDVVAAADSFRAVPLAHPQRLHGGDHHALGAEPPDVIFQLAPGVVPRLADQLGPSQAISALPEPQRAWRLIFRSSCRDEIEMPSTSPAGTQPAMINSAKSCPDTSRLVGRCTEHPRGAGRRVTAVPRAR